MPHTWFLCAQRRPGPRPRRHRYRRGGHGDNGGRSTKAGAETPATRLPELPGRDHEIMRSTKAGAETPATPVSGRSACYPRHLRSTKAGAETPATHEAHLLDIVVGHLRSTKAGAETPATRDAASRLPRFHRRSTKAGAETPATQSPARGTRSGTATLNEGRGRDPGDTSTTVSWLSWAVSAQRRPGPRPRRHTSWGPRLHPCRIAQRRPGPRPRRHC